MVDSLSIAVAVAAQGDSIGIALPVVPVFDVFVKVLDAVTAQRGIALDGEPRRGTDASLQLQSYAVGVLDVGGQVLADVTDLACLHKLVLILHVVSVQSYMPVVGRVVVAQLIVHQLFGLRSGIGAIVGEVVTLRFTMAHGQRAIDAVTSKAP